jgi:acyl-CoA reductase-like NAD-dependent aldehyde dehydrogenase
MASPRTSAAKRPAAAAKKLAAPAAERRAAPAAKKQAAPAAERRAAPPKPASRPSAGEANRRGVRKTYKLFVGGAFPRSESGRSYPVPGADGALLAYAAQASRKDLRDAVVAARKAQPGWAKATAYNRGQVLYRVAEMLDGRAAQFADEVAAAEGLRRSQAETVVAETIDRWVWYAGWSDKVAQIAGASNPVAGPYFNFSVPEPTGVVVTIAPADSSLLGLVSVLAPVIVTGNVAVVIAAQDWPLPAIVLSEVLATSDIPAGVVNVLTGYTAELALVAAAHMDVNAIDLTGVTAAERAALERAAAANLKRVYAADDDWLAAPGPGRMLAMLETKTVWHPVGT